MQPATPTETDDRLAALERVAEAARFLDYSGGLLCRKQRRVRGTRGACDTCPKCQLSDALTALDEVK